MTTRRKKRQRRQEGHSERAIRSPGCSRKRRYEIFEAAEIAAVRVRIDSIAAGDERECYVYRCEYHYHVGHGWKESPYAGITSVQQRGTHVVPDPILRVPEVRQPQAEVSSEQGSYGEGKGAPGEDEDQ